MRVAIVYRLDRPGGVQSCAFSLVKGLNHFSDHRQGHSPGIVPDILWDIPPNPALLKRLELQAGFRPLRFPFPSRLIDRLPESLRYLAWMANLVDEARLKQKYDFYYIFYNGFLVPESTPHMRYLSGPPLLPQLENIPAGPRGLPIRLFKGLYRGGLKRFRPVYEFHRRSRYVINSHFTAGLFAEAHGVELPVVHPPIDLAGRSFSAADLSHRDTLAFFSRMVDYKRPEMVLELAFRHPHLRCVIMGSVAPHRRPFFESLRERARQAGRPDIVFLDTPSTERVREELARTRYYVFPARNEHFGMSTPEAIASGAIPYVHDSGGQREIVPDPRLRFRDEVFFDQFDTLLQTPEAELNALRCRLAEHVRQYSEAVFISKMLSFLP
jgi:glycosyltransferase involved in cell wall biosynthesis